MTTSAERSYDVVVVGAGFAGLYALLRLRDAGFSVRVLEAAPAIGGTWYWNAYPGARCDVESYQYSYSFSPELDQDWEWSERYATQPEILAYVNHVADRFDLRRDIQLGTRVTAATFDEDSAVWTLDTESGVPFIAKYLLFATGSLSAPLAPPFAGVDRFRGESYCAQTWPHRDVDLTGKRVAVIGTGSSGVQMIPVLAERAAELTVFQRTANFSAPGRNRVLSDAEIRSLKANYPRQRELQNASNGLVVLDVNRRAAAEMSPDERAAELEKRWDEGGVLTYSVVFRDVLTSPETNELIADFIRNKIRDKVDDPAIADLLCPADHPFGGKRPCLDHGYYETYNRDNVSLVSIKDNPIAEITEAGVRLADGTEHELDVICYANGYDAITGALQRIDIRGRGGISLRDEWSAGPRTYLGLGFAGFPNLFSIAGPGSPAVLAMMIGLGEQNVDWITDCLTWMRDNGIETIEPRRESQNMWTDIVSHAADSVYAYRTVEGSYYKGANVPGKPNAFAIFIGGMRRYRSACDLESDQNYAGFLLGASKSKGQK